jgi:superfamily II DNA or RNA helicase
MNAEYQDFLARKRIIDPQTGFEPVELNPHLYDFQRDVVKWAVRRGRAALFEDCGLGKSLQQLEWARQVCLHTGKPVLILCPPSVREQTRDEGARFGIPCNIANSDDDIKPALCPDLKPFKGIHITNYEKLHKFDASKFAGVVLDESSILKAYDGKTRTQIIEAFRHAPYKLACTATPAPNDYMELGNHAEFIGAMTRAEMLSMFFVHDGGDTSKWRLKGHAQKDYWQWLCSWAVNLRRPSDLGYDDTNFVLPPMTITEHIVESDAQSVGFLFEMPVSSLQERRQARRGSIEERCQAVADMARASKGKVLIWCDLNDEQHRVAKMLGDNCVSIEGSTPEEDRPEMLKRWRDCETKALVSKSAIYGFGLNLQFCDTVIYCGISDSYESFYQSVRRCWRYGQKNPVKVHIVISRAESAVLSNIKRKQADAERMAAEMIAHMAPISSVEIKGATRTMTNYEPTIEMTIPEWLQGEAA